MLTRMAMLCMHMMVMDMAVPSVMNNMGMSGMTIAFLVPMVMMLVMVMSDRDDYILGHMQSPRRRDDRRRGIVQRRCGQRTGGAESGGGFRAR